MNTLLSYASYISNYNVINIENMMKFHYITLVGLSNDERIKYIDNMRLIMGKTYTDSVRFAIFSKFPNSDLLKLF